MHRNTNAPLQYETLSVVCMTRSIKLASLSSYFFGKIFCGEYDRSQILLTNALENQCCCWR